MSGSKFYSSNDIPSSFVEGRIYSGNVGFLFTHYPDGSDRHPESHYGLEIGDLSVSLDDTPPSVHIAAGLPVRNAKGDVSHVDTDWWLHVTEDDCLILAKVFIGLRRKMMAHRQAEEDAQPEKDNL